MSEGGIVIVLGAGASKCAGAPVMNDFFDTMRRLYKRGKLEVDEYKYRRILDYVRGQLLASCNIKSQIDTDNIEAVYSSIEIIRLIDGIKNDRFECTRVDAENYIKYLEELIQLTLEASIVFPRDEIGIAPHIPYQKLAELLETYRLKRKFPVTIVSFNYDNVIDFALESCGVKYRYGFENFKDNFPRVNLYKLHGSLNWGLNQNSGEIIVHPIELGNIANNLHQYDQIRDRVTGAHLKFRSDGWRALSDEDIRFPFIIPPSSNKLESQLQLRKIWSQAATALNQSEVIIFAGYSLPESDVFFKHFFALSTFGPAEFEEIVVINPDTNAFDRVKDLISPLEVRKDRIRHIPRSFEESIDEIGSTFDRHYSDYV